MELNAVDFIKTLGVTFAALFPIVNPLGCAPIFFGLTRNYPQSAQKVLAHKIAAYGFVQLIVSSLFGSEILAFFGISLFVVLIAGGLVPALNMAIHVILSRRLAACFSSVFSSWFAMAMRRGWCGFWVNQAQAF